MMRGVLVILCVLATAACAARSTPRGAAPPLRAQALVEQGCYDCLLEARAIYEALPASSRRAAAMRLLELDLLLALREKELALDPARSLARANATAVTLGLGMDVTQVLTIAAAVPPDAAGTPRADRLPSTLLAGRDRVDAAKALVAKSPFSATFRTYLTLALDCDADAAVDLPLLQYRRAICAVPVDAAALEAVRAAVPQFVETTMFLGKAALGSLFGSDGSRARQLFEAAYARFPESPSVTYHLATIAQAVRDCRLAERYFTETLALRETHEDARLGRAICRTYLSETDGAIADATVLIDAVAGNRAEAYYWRAWNRRFRKELDLARADIERSRALLYNARVLTLAGIIEYDQDDFEPAREDLSRAREMDARECQARWYLGLVGFRREQWAASAAGFAEAADCYAASIAETTAQREAMVGRTDVSEEFRARQLAGFDAAIAEDTTQKSAADLNAAINYARAGNLDQATVYMKRAAVDPERRMMVEDLRQVLGVPRW